MLQILQQLTELHDLKLHALVGSGHWDEQDIRAACMDYFSTAPRLQIVVVVGLMLPEGTNKWSQRRGEEFQLLEAIPWDDSDFSD